MSWHNENRPYDGHCDNYEDDFGYTQDELDWMNQAAFEGDPEAQWNMD